MPASAQIRAAGASSPVTPASRPSVEQTTAAPAIPWTARAVTSTPNDGATAQVSEAAANTTTPTVKTGTGPRRATNAAGRAARASARLNDVSAQARVSILTSYRARISGRAMVTTDESARTMATPRPNSAMRIRGDSLTEREGLRRAVPAATRSLDRDDVARLERPGRLGWNLLAVQQVAPWYPGESASDSLRREPAPLTHHGEAARLEHPHLAHHAVPAAQLPTAARAAPEPLALDPQRVRELERLDRGREGVRHRHVHGVLAVGAPARALPAADRLVVREPVVSERDVVHRALALSGHVDCLAESGEDGVDDSVRRLDVSGHDGRRPAGVHERAIRSPDAHGGEGTSGGGHVRLGQAADDEVAG